jgi:hypothetical protein
MFHIAEQKKNENIVEYLLYLWQMEDLLRGVNFNVSQLETRVLSEIDDEQQRSTNVLWFKKLAADMRDENLQKSGHHHETDEVLSELMLLQQTLITTIDDLKFKKVYGEAKPMLDEFRLKMDRTPKNDIDTALTAIYGVLTLKLAGKEISPETRAALVKFKAYLRHLATAYHKMKAGKLPLQN